MHAKIIHLHVVRRPLPTLYYCKKEATPAGRKQITKAANQSADKHVTVGHPQNMAATAKESGV